MAGVKYYDISVVSGASLESFSFTYASSDKLAAGQLVEVPFGRRQALGVVMSNASKPDFKTREVTAVLEQLPIIPADIRDLAVWLADYYVASAKAVWQTVLPAGLTKRTKVAEPKPLEPPKKPAKLPKLTDEQQAALTKLRKSDVGGFLLQGITGSGKTRLYLDRTADMIAAGKSAIILVPEIALTPQLVKRFEQRFGNIVVTLHSKLTPVQRRNLWLRIATAQQPLVIVGARSALFAPLANVGLIVVDEEHEASYKQSQSPRYHAVVAAARRAQLAGCQLILGSATPSLQSVFLAQAGRLQHLVLTTRATGQLLPEAHIIDLRDKGLLRRSRFISAPLLAALEQTLGSGRQSLLFINRRGSASSQICGSCGEVRLCPNCSIPLTFHADTMRLMCHYCGYKTQPSATCGNCGSGDLRYLGGGTKRIEAEIKKLLPTARLARLDKDSGSLEHIQAVHDGLNSGEIDILIGTQIIAKGLDIGNLDVVGVVSADTALHFPDYSAAERTVQLLSQVIGRAGRGSMPGAAYIQTYTPDHPAILAAAHHNFNEFTGVELTERQAMHYPPHVYLLKLQCSLSSQAAAKRKAEELATAIRGTKHTQLLGPAPAFMERMAGKYRWQIVVKSPQRHILTKIVRELPSGWTSDLDPINLL